MARFTPTPDRFAQADRDYDRYSDVLADPDATDEERAEAEATLSNIEDLFENAAEDRVIWDRDA